VCCTSNALHLIFLRPFVFCTQKKQILEAVSFTSNGKTATPEQQAKVLALVRKLETEAPPSDKLLSDPAQAQVIDGTWYLQYTSPSNVGDADEFPDSWKPEFATEGEANIETKQFQAKGSVSAAGIKVDTSNRVVEQIIDVAQSRVTNRVNLGWGTAIAGGTFRQSTKVPNRAVVSFDTAEITLNNGLKIDLGFAFSVIGFLRRSKENGWLETTFVDGDMRIGRGNKGTMFVLTRNADAVQP